MFTLNWNRIFEINKLTNRDESGHTTEIPKELANLLNKHKDVFRSGMGTLQDTWAQIQLKDDVTPHYYKPRPVPYALRSRIDAEFDILVKEGVLRPVEYSKWAVPIVPVVKGDNGIRICGDYKMTVDKESICDNYPLPKTEDLFASLNGGEKFTKLDLAHAYQQVMLESESRKLLTINTHRGLFEPSRLQFGVHSATGIFQREK